MKRISILVLAGVALSVAGLSTGCKSVAQLEAVGKDIAHIAPALIADGTDIVKNVTDVVKEIKNDTNITAAASQ